MAASSWFVQKKMESVYQSLENEDDCKLKKRFLAEMPASTMLKKISDRENLFWCLINKEGFIPSEYTRVLGAMIGKSNEKRVEMLLAKGVPLLDDAVYNNDDNCLHRAIITVGGIIKTSEEAFNITRMILNHPDGKKLINHNAGKNGTPLSCLARAALSESPPDSQQLIDLFMEHGADPYIKTTRFGREENVFEPQSCLKGATESRKRIREKRQEYLRKKIAQDLFYVSHQFPAGVTEKIVSYHLPAEIAEYTANRNNEN